MFHAPGCARELSATSPFASLCLIRLKQKAPKNVNDVTAIVIHSLQEGKKTCELSMTSHFACVSPAVEIQNVNEVTVLVTNSLQ